MTCVVLVIVWAESMMRRYITQYAVILFEVYTTVVSANWMCV